MKLGSVCINAQIHITETMMVADVLTFAPLLLFTTIEMTKIAVACSTAPSHTLLTPTAKVAPQCANSGISKI